MTDFSSADQKSAEGSNTSGDSALVQISQGALGALIGNAKREASEKASERTRQEVSAQYQQELEQIREQAREAARAEAQRQVEELERVRRDNEQRAITQKKEAQMQEAANAIKAKLMPKFEEGAKKYSDWQETVGSYQWSDPKLAEILPLLADEGIENAEDVLHHLCEGNHIQKLKDRNPAYIVNKMKEISSSLREKQTTPVNVPSEPIKSLKPSHVKTKGDGDMTIEDWRKAPWLKG